MRNRVRLLLLVPLLAAVSAFAQEWPNKPVRVIVPFPPGGGTDTVARPLAAKLSTLSGQQFIIENRGGAGGTIGATVAAKSAADGYTVLLAPVHLSVAVSAYKNLSYDLEKDLVPVTTLAIFPDVLVAAQKVPAKNLQEFIAYTRANDGKVNCGSAGNGTTRHLSCELFNSQAGVKMVHVPYKGTGPATTALLAGEVDLIFEALGSAASHIRAGKIKPIAVTSAKRSPSFPDIPTAMESGLPNFEVTSWYGLWVPAGTPRPIVQRLHALATRGLEEQDMKDLWFKLGAEPGGVSSEQFSVFVRREIEKWGKVVRDARVTIE